MAFGVPKRETHIIDVTIANQRQGGTSHFDIQGAVTGGASGDLPGPAWALWLQTEAAKAGLGKLMIDDLPREQITFGVTGKGSDIKIKSFGVEKVAATFEIDCATSRHRGTLRGWTHHTRVDFTCGDPGLASSTSNRATAAAMETVLRERFCN